MIVNAAYHIPNGERGLRSSESWLLEENKGLREELARERERTQIARQQFRQLEETLHRMERAA